MVREQEAVPSFTTEGRGYERQFPEERLLEQLSKSAGKASLSGIKDQIGLVWAKKNGWVELDKGQIKLTEAGKGDSYRQKAIPLQGGIERAWKAAGEYQRQCSRRRRTT